MGWPFVLRRRFEDLERKYWDLKKALSDKVWLMYNLKADYDSLKKDYDRAVDVNAWLRGHTYGYSSEYYVRIKVDTPDLSGQYRTHANRRRAVAAGDMVTKMILSKLQSLTDTDE